MRCKSWPYYKDWVIIFGKDRATGESGVQHSNLGTEPSGSKYKAHGNNYVSFVKTLYAALAKCPDCFYVICLLCTELSPQGYVPLPTHGNMN